MEIDVPQNVEIWEKLPDKAKKDLTAIAMLERITPQNLILSWIYANLDMPEIVMSPHEYYQELKGLDD